MVFYNDDNNDSVLDHANYIDKKKLLHVLQFYIVKGPMQSFNEIVETFWCIR